MPPSKVWWWLTQKKSLCNCLSTNKEAAFPWKIVFTWKGDWHTNSAHSDLGIWQIIFWKWSEPVISRKITESICYQWQHWNFEEKIKIFGNFYLNSAASQNLKDFLHVISSDVSRWIMKCFSISKTCTSQSTDTFTNEQWIMIQNHTWIMDPFKV